MNRTIYIGLNHVNRVRCFQVWHIICFFLGGVCRNIIWMFLVLVSGLLWTVLSQCIQVDDSEGTREIRSQPCSWYQCHCHSTSYFQTPLRVTLVIAIQIGRKDSYEAIWNRRCIIATYAGSFLLLISSMLLIWPWYISAYTFEVKGMGIQGLLSHSLIAANTFITIISNGYQL